MRQLLKLILCVVFFLEVTEGGTANAQESTAKEEKAQKFERVGGTFVVTSIKHLKDGGFRIVFTAKEGEPRFKTLVLESSHVHVSVSEGSELRLSADIVATKGNTAEVSQMVLFVPGRVGSTPVWMLSKRARSPLPPAKLLEMHAPSTDYQML